jgi:xylan 1,4-beta-xylosidase
LITNPILPGFHPDPSIIRVEDDYYIAVSTFEWFPGVLIYHSRDLIHWQLVVRPLNRTSQLDMVGVPDSGGVWAPCLSYDNGTFYLAYTNVKNMKGIWRDMPNYLVTAQQVDGEWSEPIYLNSVGHDPSIFHDDDGSKWLVQMKWEYENGKNVFGGIVLQEYSPESNQLTGPQHMIFRGTERGFTEAPHLYKRNGYYYLITAEGGTWYEHCVTMARSTSIMGPYELHPDNPILTSEDDESLELQKAGHADLVETQDGEWYMVHLCGRPLERRGRCVLGRETAIQKVEWKEDGWLYMAGGGHKPRIEVKALELSVADSIPLQARDDFEDEALGLEYQTLRIPLGEEWMSLKERRGFLRLRGRESLSSQHAQSLVARRQQSHVFTAQTYVEFMPDSSRQMAGLIAYYNTDNYYYVCLSKLEESDNVIVRLLNCSRGIYEEPTGRGLSIGQVNGCHFKLEVDRDQGRFSYSLNSLNWEQLEPILDMGRLSDDYIGGKSFTGNFVGICCQDLSGSRKHADFDYFEYRETVDKG